MVEKVTQEKVSKVQGQGEPSEEMALATLERAVLPEKMIAQLGLPKGLRARELPGVSPTWMPSAEGATIAGMVRQVKHGVGRFNSSLVVLATRDGFRTVWLGADLKRKLENIQPGALVIVEYQGRQKVPGRDVEMRTFRVYEILPAA